MTLSLRSIFDRSPRRAIHLSNDKLAVYHWNNGRLGSSYLFDASSDGQRYFDRYLKETPKLTTYMVVDVVEEEFRQNKVPHVSGSDRKAVITRKKDRLFRNTPYFDTEVQGRETEGRKDDYVLFMALTNPELVEPWVELLDANKVPLAGIISLPRVIRECLESLPEAKGDLLVVSLQSISGLRQTFFKNGIIKLSRLVTLPRYGTEPYAPLINEELELIQRYLNSLRLISHENPLDIYYLGNKALLNELALIQTDSSIMRHHRLDLAEYGLRAGLKTEVRTPFSDQFFMYHLLKKRPKNSYASDSERRYHTLRNIKQFMYAASIFMLLGSFIWGGLNLMEGMLNKQQSTVAEKKTEFYNARLRVAQDKLRKTEVLPQELEVITGIADTLAQYKANPFDMYNLVSEGLERHQDIEVDEINWQTSKEPYLKLDSEEDNNRNVPVSNTNDQSGGDYLYYQIGTVKGHIMDFDGNYRKAISTVESFRDQLDAMENTYDVSIMSLPLDINPDKSLQGSSKGFDKDAEFSVRIVLGVKNEAS